MEDQKTMSVDGGVAREDQTRAGWSPGSVRGSRRFLGASSQESRKPTGRPKEAQETSE